MAKSVLELAVGTGQWDSGLKKAQRALNNFVEASGGVKGALDRDSASLQKFVQMMGKMESTATTAKGQMRDYRSSIEQLTGAYNRMSEAEKKSVGKDYLQTIDSLKAKFKEAQKSADELNKELGDAGKGTSELQGIISQLGTRFGISTDLLSGLTTGTIAYTAAIGAAAAAVAAATKAWAEYNTELAQQDNATMVVTGLKGGSAEAMTSMGRAISKTYGVDFRQTIEAANTLMSQFGITSEEAMQILRKGMQGMIQGDGPKMLQMIQQYAPAFRDAGVSASQLVAVIQNSEGGIFTDQNMAAIVMGIKNIRLMTKQTSEALQKMGIDGAKMTQQMNEGSITVFDALRQVAEKLKDVNSNSQTAGEVMQTVFGRQGAMAGTNLAKAIETLNTNLEETKTQTGEVGQKFAELESANERLEKAMRKTFEYDGWQTMTTGIKTELTDALTGVLRIVGEISDKFKDLGITGETAFAKIMTGITRSSVALQNLPIATTLAALKGLSLYGGSESAQAGTSGQSVPAGMTKGGAGQLLQQIGNFSFANSQNSPLATKYQSTQTNPNPNPNSNPDSNDKDKVPLVEGGIKGLKEFSGVLYEITESAAALQKQLAEFQAARTSATNTADYAAATQGIQLTQRRIGAQEAAIRLGVDTDSILEIEDKMKEEVENMKDNLPKLEIKAEVNADGVSGLSKEGTNAAQTWSAAAKALSSAGAALQQIEDPGVKIAGIVGQAVANIALGFAQAAASPATGAAGVFGWIAAATAGLATMVATIASIKSATAGSYEQGGIIPGSSYSGDHLTVAANSGELILTRSQQDNLAAQLQSVGNVQSMMGQPYTTGENIVLGINNHFKRSGQGEIVTTGMLRKYGLL